MKSDHAPRGLIVLGTGGHASVVVDLANNAGYSVVGCVGPEPPAFPDSFCRYLGGDDALGDFDPASIYLAIGVGSVGDAGPRRKLFESRQQHGFCLPALIHHRAVVARSAQIGAGTQIMAGVVVNPFAVVGENVILNTNATVEHHGRIGAHVHVAPGATVCGSVSIGEAAHIGAGSVVLQGLSIGAWAIVGGGATVTRDVPDAVSVVGSPARVKAS